MISSSFRALAEEGWRGGLGEAGVRGIWGG